MKKCLSILLAITLVVGMIPLFAVTTSALDTVLTDNGERIFDYLKSDGDVKIKLTGKAVWKPGQLQDNTYACVLGSGTKRIDLNGYQLCANVKDAGSEQHLYMFKITDGSTLIIDDSSSKKTGEVYFDGYFHAAASGALGSQSGTYTDSSVVYRNGVYIEGGKLIWNGGTLVGGRSKAQYLSYGLSLSNYNKYMTMYNPEIPVSERYFGDVRQQINCTGITQYGGEVVINGGVIEGRGFRYMSGDNFDTRAEAVYSRGGWLTVNNGTFHGMGGSNVFYVDRERTHFSILACEVSLHKVDKILYPKPSSSMYGTPPVYIDGSYGIRGISNDDFDLNKTKITTGANVQDTLTAEPRHDGALNVYARGSSGVYPINDGMPWDGVTPAALSVRMDPYWNAAFARHADYETEYSIPYHHFALQVFTFAGEPDPDAQIIVGGNTNDVLEGKSKADALVRKTYIVNPLSCVFYDIPLTDIVPADYNGTDTLTVCVLNYNFFRSGVDDNVMLYHASTKVLKINGVNETVKVTHDPSSTSGSKGTITTFTARASGNPTDAWWEELTPNAGWRYEPTSFSDGVSTLRWDGSRSVTVRACFKGKYGTVRSKPASFTMVPGNGSGFKYITMYAADGKGSFTSDTSIYGTGYTSVKLQKAKQSGSNYSFDDTYLTLGSHITVNPYHTVTIHNPTDADEGRYRLVAEYPDGSCWTSETFVVNVEDGYSPGTITSAEIEGMGDLYTGEVPPTKDELWTNDDRYSITGVTWGGLNADGTLGANSYVNITIYGNMNGNSRYRFAFDDEGEFRWVAHGNNRAIYGRAYQNTQNKTVDSLMLSYTFDNHTYLQPALDSISMEQSSFDLVVGQEVDIQLAFNLTCPDKHPERHYIDSLSIDATTPLPAGLSIDNGGHITGTLTEQPSDNAKKVVVHFGGNLYNELAAMLTFNIYASSSEIVDISGAVHEHTYGDWVEYNEGMHMRTCTSCSDVSYAPHCWSDDGVIVVYATAEHAGEIMHTCIYCGATRSVPYTYEESLLSYTVGDVDADGDVDNTDAVILKRYVMKWDGYASKIKNPEAADLDGDGDIDNTDAVILKRCVMDWSGYRAKYLVQK